MKNIVISVVFLIIATNAVPQNQDCLSPTPPMGWNSWNWHGKQAVDEALIMETIDAMVESGLRDAGYEYVVIDGGWRSKGRTAGPS